MMKVFFKLIRWQNLLFIFITQILFEYCVIVPAFAEVHTPPNLRIPYIFLLALSSMFIAGGGNIINDYFDVNIDQINKPKRLIIGKYMHRHWAIMYHILFSVIGVALGFWIEYKTRVRLLGITNLGCVILLFIYSIVLKRKPLSGNILVAVLTAWTVLVVTFCESNYLIHTHTALNGSKLFRLTFLYAGFAFIISLVREMIKDMEDVEGDRRYDCRTFPILFGMNAAKIYSATWLGVLIVLLAIMIFYILQFRWWMAVAYSFVFILVPCLYTLKKLLKANNSKDFHVLSQWVKWIMLTGILSMIFLLIEK